VRLRFLPRLGVLLLVAALSVSAQTGTPPQDTKRPTSTPYSGDLSIFETPGRAQKLHIDEVMNALAIAPGKSVADIGAGSGWFTVRAAKRVESSGTVYAVDINPEAITYIDKRAKKAHLANIKTIRSRPDNPELPTGSVDSVLFLKAYHEVADPVTLLRNLRASLRPDARIGIIERNGNGTDHGVNRDVVLHEADEAGYRLIDEHDSLVKDDGMDYFIVLGAK